LEDVEIWGSQRAFSPWERWLDKYFSGSIDITPASVSLEWRKSFGEFPDTIKTEREDNMARAANEPFANSAARRKSCVIFCATSRAFVKPQAPAAGGSTRRQRQNPQQLTLCPSAGTAPALAGSESSLANAVGRNRHTRKLLPAAPTPS
jgi:hypothetical protein